MRTPLLTSCLLAAAFAWPVLADDAFEITQLDSEGRTAAAELEDLDGDGRVDLLQSAFLSFPPNESRWIRVFRGGPDGLSKKPDLVWAMPDGAAAYDLADVLPSPGIELLLLRAKGVIIVSFAGDEPVVSEVPVPDTATLAAAQDERGIDRARLVWTVGDERWIILPLPGEAIALSPTGEVKARLSTGTRANYLLPPRPGPVFVESELQVFIDVPTLTVGNVDNDGRPDIVSASRHDVRVFLQRPDGSFPHEPDTVTKLGRVTEQDHLRGSGAVRVQLDDFNRDGQLDVWVSEVAGALTDARTRSTIHINKGAGWDLTRASQIVESAKAWTADQLIDLDGDGGVELVRIEIPITVMEMVEMLITRSLDADISIHKFTAAGTFEEKAWLERKFDIPFSFDTGRPKGFIPTVNADLNGDGALDYLSSAEGESIEVYLGGPEYRFRKRYSEQELESQGRVRFGDVNGDGLQDFVLYSPRLRDMPVRIATNLGTLPGGPPRMTPAAQ